MDFWKAILGLARRPAVGPPVLLLSIGLAALAYFLVPTHYLSSTTMVLTTPTTGGIVDPSRPSGLSNPLLNFGDGLKTTSSILIQAMNTPEAAAQLGIVSDGTTKVVINDGSTNPLLLGADGPFVYVEGDSTSASSARDVVTRAQQMIREQLASRQEALDAPPSTFITAIDVVPPSVPEAQLGAKYQAAAAALVVGVLGGLGGTYLALGVVQARRRRQEEIAGETQASGTAAAEVAWPKQEPDAPRATPSVPPRPSRQAVPPVPPPHPRQPAQPLPPSPQGTQPPQPSQPQQVSQLPQPTQSPQPQQPSRPRPAGPRPAPAGAIGPAVPPVPPGRPARLRPAPEDDLERTTVMRRADVLESPTMPFAWPPGPASTPGSRPTGTSAGRAGTNGSTPHAAPVNGTHVPPAPGGVNAVPAVRRPRHRRPWQNVEDEPGPTDAVAPDR